MLCKESLLPFRRPFPISRYRFYLYDVRVDSRRRGFERAGMDLGTLPAITSWSTACSPAEPVREESIPIGTTWGMQHEHALVSHFMQP